MRKPAASASALFLVLITLALTPAPAAAEPARLDGVVNINTAAPDELELLPGVGPAKARLIVEYRAKHAFRTVEELARVKGIGPRTVRKLRPNLVVRGPTTAQAPARRKRRAPGS
jgi:competence protein ComEA